MAKVGEPEQRSPLCGIVDVHAHLTMPSYQNLLAKSGYVMPGYGVPAIGPRPNTLPSAPNPKLLFAADDERNVEQRLALMERAGVAHQMLSTSFAPYFEDVDAARNAARFANDILAKIANEHPKQLSSFVALPLPHVDESLAEIRRGMDTLGMVGVGIQCFCLSQSVADDRFIPIYEELNRREAVLFFHPCVNGICSPFITEWGLNATAGVLFEDTTVALHLIIKKVPFRYPKIKFIIPHLGGALPMVLNRLDNQLPLSVPDLPEKPSRTLRRFWYDSVAHASRAACNCAIEAFGENQLLAGSDFPYLLPFEEYAETFNYMRGMGLREGTIEKIFYRNARDLFGRSFEHVAALEHDARRT
jgi:6-methylsalicylate decarboxylase